MSYTVKKTSQEKQEDAASGPGLITFDKFYDLVDETTKADLLDGRIVRDSPAVPRHALIVTWLTSLINIYAEKFDLGTVLGATTTVRLTKYQAPEPDVLFIRKSRLAIIGERYVDGPPDLCVEVISRTSEKLDRGRKLVLYADHGVQEYWIIDPLHGSVEFYQNQQGEWVTIKPDSQGRLHSHVLPGFWLNPDWLAADPLPPVLEALEEICATEFRSPRPAPTHPHRRDKSE